MFTGIIQELGILEELRHHGGGTRMVVRRTPKRDPIGKGESVAVDGVCLTAVSGRKGRLEADLSPETMARSTLGTLQKGAALNLERPLRLTDRLGGHLVQGHVDTVGQLVSRRSSGGFVTCRWRFPPEFRDLVVPKGSIAVNGVSLTIVDPDEDSFAAALIPETLEQTNLGRLQRGDSVNLEFDLVAKLIVRLLQPYRPRLGRE
jgi:riboflavin synthase